MLALAILGFLLVFGILIAGIYWIGTNVTVYPTKSRYTYEKDINGDEKVVDNTDLEN